MSSHVIKTGRHVIKTEKNAATGIGCGVLFGVLSVG